MDFQKLLQKIKDFDKTEAIIWRDKVFTYAWLDKAIQRWKHTLLELNIKTGEVVEIEGDYSPATVALLLALVDKGSIVVPMAKSSSSKKESFRKIAQIESSISIDEKENVSCQTFSKNVNHPLLLQLKNNKHAGLILFSSGSTGESKAIVHDWNLLLEKYKKPSKARRIMVFLLFDHIGGINTLMHTLFNGGCVVIVKERTPLAVCELIDKYKVQVLPTSPTFLNLLLHSHLYQKYDLKSLELITYGTEVMPEIILKRLHTLFPDVRLSQTYGLTEIGILKTQSKSSESLFMKIGDQENPIRINDGKLEIKATTTMLGYLNAESPFTEDGWFKTGDLVEEEEGCLRIIGRSSDIINVGGEKVYPAQVENIIEQMENVEDVVVTGEKSPVTGQIVKATVKLKQDENLMSFRKRMMGFCKNKLALFEIPQKIVFVDKINYGERFKKSHKSC